MQEQIRPVIHLVFKILLASHVLISLQSRHVTCSDPESRSKVSSMLNAAVCCLSVASIKAWESIYMGSNEEISLGRQV